MLEKALRHHYQRILVVPVVKKLIHAVSPNTITLLGAFIGILFMPFLLLKQKLAALLCLLISGYLDTLDGTLARAQNNTSALGTILDIMSDRIVECFIIISFYLSAPENKGLLSIIMLGSVLLCVTSFLVVGVFSENNSNKSFNYSPGLIERAEAFIFFALMTLFPQYFNPLAIVFSGLVLWTAIIRIVEFYTHAAS